MLTAMQTCPGATGHEVMLDISGLSVDYGALRAVDNVSLQVHRGEITTVAGLNGAGKTSLIKGIFNMVPLSSGTVTYCGQSLQGLHPWQIIRLGIGYVAEQKHLFLSMSVHENLELAALGGQTKARLAEVYDIYPQLRDHADKPAGTLSGGMQQMLAIGRCLAAQPQLLILDEPSIGLAPCVVTQMFALLTRLKTAGYTVLLVEQNMRAAAGVCDRACYLELGETVSEEVWLQKFNA